MSRSDSCQPILRRTALVLYFHGTPQIPRQIVNHAVGDDQKIKRQGGRKGARRYRWTKNSRS